MRSSADRILRVVVQVCERRTILARLLIRERIRKNGVFRQFGQADVARHIVQIGAVVLAHEEELAAVAEYSGADAALNRVLC